MKKSRFTEEQVIYALRLAESGTLVTDVCQTEGITLQVPDGGSLEVTMGVVVQA